MDKVTDDNKTPVIVACEFGNSAQLKILLDEGAPITNIDVHGKTALHYCADNLETQCAEMLLVKDMSILDVKDEQGYTALALAVLVGNVNLIKLLIDKGADINTEDKEGHKLAHWVAVCGHLKVLDILIEHNADLSSPDSHHAYPIHYAAQMNNTNSGNKESRISEKVLRKFLDCKVKLDVVDDANRQPLLWAACSGNAESIKMLLKAGADINSQDKDDLTALHCAASRGHYECIEVLRRNGADVNLIDKNKCTPLFYSITLGNKDCTRALINAKADVNHVDDRGRNPCHCAAIKGCFETLKILEKERANMWLPNHKGDYPVHEAAQKGHFDVVKHFIRQKNNKEAINVSNKAGKTLLHIAAATNNLPLIKLLVSQDCDKNALMKHSGKEFTPYDLAVIKGYKEAADILKQNGALPFSDLSNVEKRESRSARSIKNANVEVVKEEEAIPKNDPTISPVQEEKPLKAVEPAAPVVVIPTAVEKSETVESEKAVIGTVKNSPKRKKISKKPDNPKLDKAVGIDKLTTAINTDVKSEDSLITETKDAITQKNGPKEREKATSTTSIGQAQRKEKVVPPKKNGHKTKLNKTDNEESSIDSDPTHVHRRKHKGHKSSTNKIRISVKNYEDKRNLSRSFNQLRRAQIHTGPMHDIVMFSRMMDNYRRGAMGEEEEIDINKYASWDGNLNESAIPREGFLPRIVMKHQELQHKKGSDMNKQIDESAINTTNMFESVKSRAQTSAKSAKTYNLWLCEQIKQAKEEQLRNMQDPKERAMLQSQLLQEQIEEHEHASNHAHKEHHKKSHRRKDEVIRNKLLQTYRPYFPNDMFNKKYGGLTKSARRVQIEAASTSCPRPELSSPRPLSYKSEGHPTAAQHQHECDTEKIHMTPYGLRIVNDHDRSSYAYNKFKKLFMRKKLRKLKIKTNWSQKYDAHIRPRTSLVFVEPRVYDNLLKEEKVIKNRISSNVQHHHMANGDIHHSDQPVVA